MEITGGRASRGVICGARIVVPTVCGTITIAIFPCFDQIIGAYRGAIIIVKIVATRCAAPIVIGAIRHIDIVADSIAGSGRSAKGVGSATIGVVACGGAIPITDFACFYDVISATWTAIVIVIIIAASGAAPIPIFTSGDFRKNTDCGAIRCTSAQRIRCTSKAIIASGWTIPIAGFAWLDDIIGAERSTIIIVKIIAALSAATVA